MSKEKRNKILQRDGHKCKKCGSSQDLTIDHIVPLLYGGTNIAENLQTLCRTCNQRKGSMFNIPFVMKLKQLFHFQNILNRFRNEWRGVQASLMTEIATRKKESDERYNTLNSQFQEYKKKQEATATRLASRIVALEDYHKINYVEETIEVRKYVKRPKA